MVKLMPQLFCTEEEKFREIEPVRNTKFVKPEGGLWTSTYTPDKKFPSAWVEWCVHEMQEWLEDVNFFLLIPRDDANVYVIDSYKDLKHLYKRFGISSEFGFTIMDWEEIAKEYDAVMLTEEGEISTRFSTPLSLHGWDCESTLWFRDVFESVKRIEIQILI